MSHGHEDSRAVDSQTLSAHAAGTQNDGAAAQLPMQADGRDDPLIQTVSPAVGLDLVAYLDRSVHGIRRGTGEDGPISEQHRCGTVILVIGKARVDQVIARSHGRSQGSLIHTATVAGAPSTLWDCKGYTRCSTSTIVRGMDEVLAVRDLRMRYGKTDVLDGVSFAARS